MWILSNVLCNGQQDYDLVLFDKLIPSVKVKLPEAYIIPVEWTDIIDRLNLHGIEYETIENDKEIEITTYKFNFVFDF